MSDLVEVIRLRLTEWRGLKFLHGVERRRRLQHLHAHAPADLAALLDALAAAEAERDAARAEVAAERAATVEHIRWTEDGLLMGTYTATAREALEALGMEIEAGLHRQGGRDGE